MNQPTSPITPNWQWQLFDNLVDQGIDQAEAAKECGLPTIILDEMMAQARQKAIAANPVKELRELLTDALLGAMTPYLALAFQHSLTPETIEEMSLEAFKQALEAYEDDALYINEEKEIQ